MEKKNKGRQKTELVKMEKESNLHVTFSKRRTGLFKKASEICTLCGAEVALMVFSPGQKVYSFGHPCVESVIERFLSGNPSPDGDESQYFEAHRNANIRELNMQLTHFQNLLDAENKRAETIDQTGRACQSQDWWDCPIDELNLQQLEHLKAAMEDLRRNVHKQKLTLKAVTSSPLIPLSSPLPLGDGSIVSGDFIPFGAEETRSGNGGPFDTRNIGPSGAVPFNFASAGYSTDVSFGAMASGSSGGASGSNGGVPVHAMASGFGGGVPFDTGDVGFVHGVPFDPWAAGSSAGVSYDVRGSGFISKDPFDATGFGGGVPFDARASGFIGVPFDHMETSFTGAVPFDPRETEPSGSMMLDKFSQGYGRRFF